MVENVLAVLQIMIFKVLIPHDQYTDAAGCHEGRLQLMSQDEYVKVVVTS